jgi:hypothetical protein
MELSQSRTRSSAWSPKPDRRIFYTLASLASVAAEFALPSVTRAKKAPQSALHLCGSTPTLELGNFRDLQDHSFSTTPFSRKIVAAARVLGAALISSDTETHRLLYDATHLLREIAPHLRISVSAEDAIIKLPVPSLAIPTLPHGFGFKGGVARKVLALVLRANIETSAVRDLDCIAIGDHRDTSFQDVSRRYMGCEWEWTRTRQRGVEPVTNRAHFFNRRDFTINELFVVGDTLHLSLHCVADTLGGIIRPSLRYRKEGMTGLLATKALRFMAQAEFENRPLERERGGIAPEKVTAFDVAVHLKRSLYYGDKVARRFLELVKKCEYLRSLRLSDDVASAMQTLQAQLQEPNFFDTDDNGVVSDGTRNVRQPDKCQFPRFTGKKSAENHHKNLF